VNTDPRIRPDLIVLVGFMAAGKSTIGPRLARALDWQFFDVDEEIERRSGISIADFFRTRGESAFRALEQSLTQELSSVPHVVLAPGGGWAASARAFEQLPHGACVVWLRITAEEALRRAQASPVVRPLLHVADPLKTARNLLAQREKMYSRAHITIDVDARTPDEIVEDIIERIR
jgi:shikimate kinase